MKTNNKICFISLGCPKALVDSEQVITRLKLLGYEITNNYAKAKLVIINTCGFINEAIEESLASIEEALAQNGNVIVFGCLGAKKEVILNKFSNVLNIFGTNSTNELIQAVEKFMPVPLPQFIELPSQGIKLTPKHYAYLKISEGCNHRCSYCIIPQLRGSLKSRPLKDILHEAEILVESGCKELLIISQDTGAYGSDLANKQDTFNNLITELAKLNIWIRLHYLYPYPHIDNVLPLMAEKKILPYLDVPLQHVNKRILTLMKRPAEKVDIYKRINYWREICPGITIRSTFIVGFPGETWNEFDELLDFLQEAKLDRVGCFKYSPVKGAAANLLPDQIDEEIKEERLFRLMALQEEISQQKLQNKINTKIEVLIDSEESDYYVGRSAGDAPEIDGQVYIPKQKHLTIGQFVNVSIKKADAHDLWGSASEA